MPTSPAVRRDDAAAPWHPGYFTLQSALVQPWLKNFRQHAFVAHPWWYLDVVR